MVNADRPDHRRVCSADPLLEISRRISNSDLPGAILYRHSGRFSDTDTHTLFRADIHPRQQIRPVPGRIHRGHRRRYRRDAGLFHGTDRQAFHAEYQFHRPGEQNLLRGYRTISAPDKTAAFYGSDEPPGADRGIFTLDGPQPISDAAAGDDGNQ